MGSRYRPLRFRFATLRPRSSQTISEKADPSAVRIASLGNVLKDFTRSRQSGHTNTLALYSKGLAQTTLGFPFDARRSALLLKAASSSS